MTEKTSFERVEKLDSVAVDQKLDVDEEGVKLDYSGAHAKTTPEEIALVKKLDWWIMVSIFMPFLLLFTVILMLHAAHSLVDVLAQLS